MVVVVRGRAAARLARAGGRRPSQQVGSGVRRGVAVLPRTDGPATDHCLATTEGAVRTASAARTPRGRSTTHVLDRETECVLRVSSKDRPW